MGWLFMRSLGAHATPKAYLDAQAAYTRPEGTSRVLRSALVGLRTYYAAVEHTSAADGAREVWALVCLVRYNRRDREGFIFGYKDMSESMGPCEDGCPEAILDLLTPTDNAHALDWRARCRTNIAERRARHAKVLPRPGQVVVFAEPLRFRDGTAHDRLEAVRIRGRWRTVYRSAEGWFYRIGNLRTLDFVIEEGPLRRPV